MSIRFITGSSGQGKTSYIIDEVIGRSRKNPDCQYYVIVPEQFSLEMQRNIAERHPDHGYMNIDVLSFYRLAYRVFDECGYKPSAILEDMGVHMILKKLLSEHEEEFPNLKKHKNQAGFLDELKSVLMEFICYGADWEQLMKTGKELTELPLLSRKCHELAGLYRYFEETIEGKYMVTEQILDVLCDFVTESELLAESVYYFDGFTGFTPIQLSFLNELLPVSRQINIAVTIPALPDQLPFPSGEDLFHFSEKTIRSLMNICRQAGEVLEEPVCLASKRPPRFADNQELAWLERNLFRSKREPFKNKPEKIHITSCLQPEQEAEYILHKTEYLVRKKGYRYSDFAVLTGDLAEYASAFERQAEILNIPLFVDTKKKMSYHPSIETLRALFGLTERNYSYESVFRYLKSGMSSLSDDEVDFLENYCLSAGIKGYSMWSHPFIRKKNRYNEDAFDLLEQLRIKVLEETEEFYLAWRNKKTNVQSRMAALYRQMCHLDYAGKLDLMAGEEEEKGNYVREKEYREIFGLLVRLLDKITDVFGEEFLPSSELTELMDAGMESLGLGVLPLSMDQMILGDLKRTRIKNVKVLFIAGLNDGLIPSTADQGGIITDDEKQVLADHGLILSENREERLLEDEFYIYLAFVKPEDEVYYTFSSIGRDGKARHPSSVLEELKAIFPGLMVKHYPGEEKRYYFNAADSREYLIRSLMKQNVTKKSEEEGGAKDSEKQEHDEQSYAFRLLLKYWTERNKLHQELACYFAERKRQNSPRRISSGIAADLFGKELRGSVTRLESYAACPYQYFCIYGMGLEEREEYAVHPMDIGNLFHKALEYFSEKVKDSEYNWKDMPQSFADSLISISVEQAADGGMRDLLGSTARNNYKLNSVKRILERTIKVIRLHLKDSDMEPDRFELHFGKSDKFSGAGIELINGARMYLEGYVDRVDIYEDGDSVLIRVIDYKSGMQTFDMDDLYHGLQLQLVMYMKAAGEIYGRHTGKQVVPAGMYYYQLQDPVTKADYFDEKMIQKCFRMSGYTNSSPEVLYHLEHGGGDLLSAPVRMTRQGKPYSNSPVLSTEDFRLLTEYVLKKAGEAGRDIYNGMIDTLPYLRDKKTACDYCSFHSVCGFDPKERNYKEWKKQSAGEALEAIRKQVE